MFCKKAGQLPAPAQRSPSAYRDIFLCSMYSDFKVKDRWTGEEIHCIYQAVIVAIATRHADAVDIKFLANGRPIWIALPHPPSAEYKRRTANTISDALAIHIARHFLHTPLQLAL